MYQEFFPKYYTEKVNNKEFYKTLKRYKAKYKRSKKTEIPIFIHRCFWLIANKYSFNHKFINYTYKEDMISEAFLICLKYVRSFNPDKSTNPYAYFNQAIHNAFLQTITKEKKQSIVKDECMRIEKDRREGFGRKVITNSNIQNFEEKVWA